MEKQYLLQNKLHNIFSNMRELKAFSFICVFALMRILNPNGFKRFLIMLMCLGATSEAVFESLFLTGLRSNLCSERAAEDKAAVLSDSLGLHSH